MNGASAKIDVIKPFENAFELMKRILFQPFNMQKWLVIGFAAFLSGYFGGGGGFTPPVGNLQSHGANQTPNAPAIFEQWKDWMPWLFIALSAVIFLAVIVFLWLRARGTFIFTDCVVHNRAAIAAPWREYRREGNSFFKFHLALLAIAMAVFIGIAITIVLIAAFSGWNQHTISGLVVGIGFGLLMIVWLGLWIVLSIILHFMPLVMYVRRCNAMDAFREVARLLADHPAPFVLFCLFGIALFLGLMMVGGIVTCATCCIGALPYIGTVLMLPALVWLRGYSLLFFRQFGPDYDVWAGKPLPNELSPAVPPPAPPPLPS